MGKVRFLLLSAFWPGCKVSEPGLTVLVTAEDEALVRDGLAFTPPW